MRKRYTRIVLAMFCGLLAFGAVSAQVRLPRLVSDSMVLPRDSKVRVWGWASPGEKVTVRFNGQSPAAVADTGGRWAVELAPMGAGGPYDMDPWREFYKHVLVHWPFIGYVEFRLLFSRRVCSDHQE